MKAINQNELTGKSDLIVQWAVLFALVGGGVAARLYCEHLPNFAPVAGASLFAGWYFSRRTFALLTPILIMGISNLWLGSYNTIVLVSVISCFIVSGFAGMYLRNGFNSSRKNEEASFPVRSRLAILGATVGGSILFFVVTNFAVWMAFSSHSLVQTYIQAIPFYRFTLYGDLFFTFVLFGSYELIVVSRSVFNGYNPNKVEVV